MLPRAEPRRPGTTRLQQRGPHQLKAAACGADPLEVETAPPCHRDGARHCACTPEGPAGDRLVLTAADPRAASALRALAAALATEVRVLAPGLVEVGGDVTGLLVAAAAALPVPAAPEPARTSLADVALPGPFALASALQQRLDVQRPGTTSAVLFCDIGTGTGTGVDGGLDAVTAARLRHGLRSQDLLAHLRAGVFVAVLSDLPLEGAPEVAARAAATVRACLDEPLSTPAGLVLATPRVGVLLHPGAGAPPAMSAADLLGAVDRALAGGPGATR